MSGQVVQIGRVSATVTADVGIDVSKVLASKPFKEWADTISNESRIIVEKIHIQSVHMFGSKVGFIKFKAVAKVEGKEVPGIVFMRGGSVAILVILECGGRQYTLLVRQPRVPVSIGNLSEIPAGMVDGDGNFAGVAAKEMKEETGIEIKENDLIDMTHLAFRNKYPGVFPSCGGSDEFNRIFLFRKSVTAQELQDLNGKLTGVIEEGEMIKLQIIPLDALWRQSPDAKALTALCLYQKLNGAGLLSKAKSAIFHTTFQPGALGFEFSVGTVTKIEKGGQAQRCGVKEGDVIKAVGKVECNAFLDSIFLDARLGRTPYQVTFETKVQELKQIHEVACQAQEETEDQTREKEQVEIRPKEAEEVVRRALEKKTEVDRQDTRDVRLRIAGALDAAFANGELHKFVKETDLVRCKARPETDKVTINGQTTKNAQGCFVFCCNFFSCFDFASGSVYMIGR